MSRLDLMLSCVEWKANTERELTRLEQLGTYEAYLQKLLIEKELLEKQDKLFSKYAYLKNIADNPTIWH